MKIQVASEEGVPEDAPEAVLELVTAVLGTIDDWYTKSEKSEGFRQAVIMTAVTNILAICAVDKDIPTEVVLMNLLRAFHLNDGIDNPDYEDQTVH